jgi:fumarate reductase flavoprotein subunit
MKKFSWAIVVLMFMTVLVLSGCDTGTSGGGKDLSYSADVIIVGAGGAGLSAAIEARKAGASVILLEKSSVVGGNTLPANAGLSAVGTQEQADAGINYSVQDYIDFHMEKGETNNLGLVTILAQKSAETVAWLKSMGASFVIRNPTATEPGMFGDDRITLSAPGADQLIGTYLIPILAQNAESSGAKIFFETTATDLITNGGNVTGVKARDNITGAAIIFNGTVLLTTGGFGQDNDMVAKYAPQYKGIITDEIAPTTGDGIKMAEKLGADTQDMGELMVIGSVEAISHDTILPPWIANGAIYVNYEGKRFGREGEVPFWETPPPLPPGVKDAMEVLNDYPPEHKQFYYVFGKSILEANPNLAPYIFRKCAAQSETPEGLAGILGISSANFAETVEKWNRVVNDGETDEFGRSVAINTPIDAPYYALRLNSGVHYCMGGLKINTDTQVLKKDGSPIIGLYAAGEVTGGIHGKYRVDGSAVTDSLLFGCLGAQKAAAYARELKAKGIYKDGNYTGSGMGRNGAIDLYVTVLNGTITEIIISNHSETPTMMDSVERDTISAIINKQSTEDIDIVSGATFTYIGVLNAVNEALNKAKK